MTRPQLLAASGNESVRAIALAAVRAGYPETDEVQVVDLDLLHVRDADTAAGDPSRRRRRSTAPRWWCCRTSSPNGRWA